MIVLGFDIGGTKTAVVLARVDNNDIEFIGKKEIDTTKNWENILDILIKEGNRMLKSNDLQGEEYKIGISCGGPLDSDRGIIKSPPNLPGWDDVPVVDYIYEKTGVKAKLQNDADACALAEWKYGAGIGYENLVFLTFGTGLGAGLILNGKLYKGANNMAGEVGHIRLEKDGPIGYGKRGSFEGFCSGGGIAQIGMIKAKELEKKGVRASFIETKIEDISAKDIAKSAGQQNEDALEVFSISGKYFGRGLSILIDILNPEIIIAGSIFARSGKFLKEAMYREIKAEALEYSKSVVEIVAAELGEEIGDYAAVVTAIV